MLLAARLLDAAQELLDAAKCWSKVTGSFSLASAYAPYLDVKGDVRQGGGGVGKVCDGETIFSFVRLFVYKNIGQLTSLVFAFFSTGVPHVQLVTSNLDSGLPDSLTNEDLDEIPFSIIVGTMDRCMYLNLWPQRNED